MARGQEIVEKEHSASLYRVVRLAHRYRAKAVATDNFFELGRSFSALKKLLRKLPPETKLVQVTGAPGEARTLEEVAQENGLPLGSKPSPLDAAAVCAILAAKGIGYELSAFEDKTEIIVSRAVSLSHGGWSQSRYRRNIHALISRATKRIEKALSAAGLSYELMCEKSDFGLERSRFVVDAPRSALPGVVKPYKGSLIRIQVKPLIRAKPEYAANADAARVSKKLIFVGIDPGTTCGVAILSMRGEPLYVGSRRGISRAELTELLLSFGEPLVVASDVSPPPDYVEKLAKSFGAVVYSPTRLLEATEKQEIASEYALKYCVEVSDSHQRDALAAVVKAFKSYEPKLKQVEARLREMGAEALTERVFAEVIRGKPLHRAVEDVAESVGKKPTPPPAPPSKAPVDKQTIHRLVEKIKEYKREIEELKEENRRLREELRSRDRWIARLKNALEARQAEELARIRGEREFEMLRSKVNRLSRRLEQLESMLDEYKERIEIMRKYRQLESVGRVIALKPIQSFTKEGLEEAFQLVGVKQGDVVLLEDASGGGASAAKLLVSKRIRAVVASTRMSHHAEEVFRKHRIPILQASELSIEWVEDIPFVSAEDLEKAIARRREVNEVGDELEKVLREYRSERMNALTQG